LEEYDTVILDGRNGPFILADMVEMKWLKNKSLLGIHHACLTSAFCLTDSLQRLLDAAEVKSYSTSVEREEPFYLSNGRRVRETQEYRTRQTLIDCLNDPDESFRLAGLLQINGCENIIVRNIAFQGPGAVDVGGRDLLNINWGATHIWIDHCDFRDGQDGNFDINTRADYITVSWCTFGYTDRSYSHRNSNLLGATDRAEQNGDSCLNVTFQCCVWGEGCDQRMPMARFGVVHVLNCLYDCPGCFCTVNPRKRSEVLIEGCVWSQGVKNIFRAKDALAYEWRDCLFAEKFVPHNLGCVTVPYDYTPLPAVSVREMVGCH